MKTYKNYIKESKDESFDDILKGLDVKFTFDDSDDLLTFCYKNEYIFTYSKKRQTVWLPNKYFYKHIFGLTDKDKYELFNIFFNDNIDFVLVDEYSSFIKLKFNIK